MSGPHDEQRPGQPPRPEQPWQPPSQQPWQPFATWPGQQFEQPVPWRPVGPPPFQPHAFASFSSVRGLGTAVSILICLVALGQGLFAASDWYTYRAVKDYVEGPVKGPGGLDRADLIAAVVAGGFLLALVVASVVFIVWLWRVRGNAELFCAGRHRRGRGWVIGAWFCPVVNLWFPKQVVDDVIAPDVNDQLIAASLSTISAALTAISAVLAIRVVSLVNRLQMSRPWTPWWASDPSAASAGQYSHGPVPPWPAQ